MAEKFSVGKKTSAQKSDIIKQQVEKIAKLRDENRELTEQLANAKTLEEYNELYGKFQEVTEALQKAMGSISALIIQAEKTAEAKAQEKIDELDVKLETAYATAYEAFREGQKTLERSRAWYRGELKRKDEELKQKDVEIESFNKEVEALRNAGASQAVISALEERLGKAVQERDQFASQVKSLNNTIDALNKDVETFRELAEVRALRNERLLNLLKKERKSFNVVKGERDIAEVELVEVMDALLETEGKLSDSEGKAEYGKILLGIAEGEKEDVEARAEYAEAVAYEEYQEKKQLSDLLEKIVKQHQEDMLSAAQDILKKDAEAKAAKIQLENDFGVHVRKLIEKAYGAVTVDGTITEQDRKVILNAVNQARKNDKKGKIAFGYNRITETIAQEYLDYIKERNISADVVRSFEKTFFSETSATKDTKEGTEKVFVATVDEEGELKKSAIAKKIIDKYTTHLTAEKAKDRRWLKLVAGGLVATFILSGLLALGWGKTGGDLDEAYGTIGIMGDEIVDADAKADAAEKEAADANAKADAAETQSGLNEIYGTAQNAKTNIDNGISSIAENKQNADNLADKIGELGLTELATLMTASETSEEDYVEIISTAYKEVQKIQNGNPEAETDVEQLSTEAIWEKFEEAYNNQNTEDASKWADALVGRAEKITGTETENGYQKTSNDAFGKLVLQVFPGMTVEQVNNLINDNEKLSTALTDANAVIEKLRAENAEKDEIIVEQENKNQELKDEIEDLENPIQTVSVVDEELIKDYNTSLTPGQKGKVESVLFCQYNKLDNLVRMLVECDNKGKTYYNYIEFNTSTAYTAPSAKEILEELGKSTCRVSSYGTKIENIKQNESEMTVFYSLAGNSNGKRADGIVISQDGAGNYTFKTGTSGSYSDSTEDFLVNKLLLNLGVELQSETSTSDTTETEPEME